jgi:tetratricopeptide (TPR) repeat protein
MAALWPSAFGQSLPNTAIDNRSQPFSSNTVSVGQLKVPAKAFHHLEAAQRHFANLQLTGAAIELHRAIDVYPAFAKAFFMDALIRLAEKDYSGSVESAAHAISLDDEDAYSWVALATAYNSLNEWSEAEAAAGRALALNPSAWQGRLELAKSFYGQGEYQLALNTMDQISKDFPDVHLIRANVLQRLGRTSEAAEQFSFFLRQAPTDARCSQIRQIGDPSSAISIGK